MKKFYKIILDILLIYSFVNFLSIQLIYSYYFISTFVWIIAKSDVRIHNLYSYCGEVIRKHDISLAIIFGVSLITFLVLIVHKNKN